MMRQLFFVATLGVAVSTLACAGPRMVTPVELAGKSQVLEATGRSNASGAFVNEDFQLGDKAVADVDRDWQKSRKTSIGGYQTKGTTTGYSYKFAGSWEGSCATLKREKGANLGGGMSISSEKSSLVCECSAGEDKAVLKLAGDDAKHHDNGEYIFGESKMELAASDHTDQSNLSGLPAGYEARVDGKVVAAVEYLKPGKVWLGEELQGKDADALSCVFAGVMLYLPPSDR